MDLSIFMAKIYVRLLLLLTFAYVLTACEPEATPFPVEMPPTIEPTRDPNVIEPTAIPIRYALAANTSGFVSGEELLQIEIRSVVEHLTEPATAEEFGPRYELVAAYGAQPGWILSDVTLRVALLVNPNAAPLDESVIAQAVKRIISPTNIAIQLQGQGIPGITANSTQVDSADAIRTIFANAGWPDGFDLTLAHVPIPGADFAAEQLRSVGLEVTETTLTENEIAAALTNGRAALALIVWAQQSQRAEWVTLLGESNVIDLYALPVSYQALPELTVSEFTAGGWPLPER